MDVSRYLERIEFGGAVRHDAETLRSLALAHLMTVPFENMDIHLGVPITLDLDAFYRKVVTHKRGGFCYELNGLFGTLLRRLGFTVDFLSARVLKRDQLGPEFDHLTLRVVLDGTAYMADVGFGDGLREPLELRPGASARFFEREYRVLDDQGALRFETHNDKGLDKGLLISQTPRKLEEFSGMCRYHTTDPRSWWVREKVATRATPDGRISILGNRRTVRKQGTASRSIISDADYLNVLRADFDIDIPRNPRIKTHSPT